MCDFVSLDEVPVPVREVLERHIGASDFMFAVGDALARADQANHADFAWQLGVFHAHYADAVAESAGYTIVPDGDDFIIEDH